MGVLRNNVSLMFGQTQVGQTKGNSLEVQDIQSHRDSSAPTPGRQVIVLYGIFCFAGVLIKFHR